MAVRGRERNRQVVFRRAPPFVSFTDHFWTALDEGVERHYNSYLAATFLLWGVGAALAMGDVLTSWALLELGFVERNPLGRALLASVGGIAFLPAKALLLALAIGLWVRLPEGLDIGVPMGIVAGNALPFVNNALLLVYVA